MPWTVDEIESFRLRLQCPACRGGQECPLRNQLHHNVLPSDMTDEEMDMLCYPAVMGERGKIRFIMARGEAGGANMADAYARTTGGLGVCLTSTCTAAGNAAGAMVEALTAGTPLLHITGQIETPYLDQSLAYIHEAPDQLTMLKAVSKAAFRVRSADTAISTMKLAVQTALTAPAGPAPSRHPRGPH